jgi:hypothetical protein
LCGPAPHTTSRFPRCPCSHPACCPRIVAMTLSSLSSRATITRLTQIWSRRSGRTSLHDQRQGGGRIRPLMRPRGRRKLVANALCRRIWPWRPPLSTHQRVASADHARAAASVLRHLPPPMPDPAIATSDPAVAATDPSLDTDGTTPLPNSWTWSSSRGSS